MKKKLNKDSSRIGAMFNSISGYYDFLNHFLSFGIDRYWRKKAVEKIEKNNPRIILDVACGTGDMMLAMKKLNPEKICGVDIAEKMLAVAEKKVSPSMNVEFKICGAENILYKENMFDAVTVAFGVRNFENLDTGLKEMCRVLKPGGMVVILEFSKPRSYIIKILYVIYSALIIPFVGLLFARNRTAYSYLVNSISSFPHGDDFLGILRDAGFINVSQQSITYGIVSVYTGLKESIFKVSLHNKP